MPQAEKEVISPGQGLLLLISHYQTQPDAIDKCDKLKKIYLSGARRSVLEAILADPLLKDYIVSYEKKTINEDSSRRYFETHLAYETLKNGLSKLKTEDLRSHFRLQDSMIFGKPDMINWINQVLEGKYRLAFEFEVGKSYSYQTFFCTIQNHGLYYQVYNSKIERQSGYIDARSLGCSRLEEPLTKEKLQPLTGKIIEIAQRRGQIERGKGDFIEYSEYIANLLNGTVFSQLTEEDRLKIRFLVRAAFLGVRNTQFSSFPLDIYHEGMYKSENRGQIERSGQDTTGSQHLGLMRGHMPLPADDLAHAEKPFSYLKPSEGTTYQEGREWVELCFSSFVHLFSASISGTILCQLRSMLQFVKDGTAIFTPTSESTVQLLKLMISALLYGSGGHSLLEFTAPLQLPKVQAAFPVLQNRTLERLFLTDNEAGFNNALQDTITYNTMLIRRKKVNVEIIANAEKERFFQAKEGKQPEVTDASDKPDTTPRK